MSELGKNPKQRKSANSSVRASKNTESKVIWLCVCAVGIWEELELEVRLRAYGEEQGMTSKGVCI